MPSTGASVSAEKSCERVKLAGSWSHTPKPDYRLNRKGLESLREHTMGAFSEDFLFTGALGHL